MVKTYESGNIENLVANWLCAVNHEAKIDLLLQLNSLLLKTLDDHGSNEIAEIKC